MGKKPEAPAKDQIRLEIVKAGPKGIFQSEIIKTTRLSRDTVHTSAKELERAGELRIERIGQRAKYSVTVKTLNDLQDKSFLLSLYACRSVLSKVATFPIADDDDDMGRLLQNDSPFVNRPTARGKQVLAYDIFDFSARVGSIVTYGILLAVNEIHRAQDNSEKSLSSLQKTVLVEKIVSKLISEMVPDELLKQFVMWFNEYDEENNHAEDAVVPKLRVEPSLYEFDEPVARQFLDAFSQAFPFISKKLEKIQVEIPKIIEKDKRLIMQNECNHEFDSKLLKERMIILRRCTKCELEESLTWHQEKRKRAVSNQS